MKPKNWHCGMTLLLATLAVVVPLLWMGQATSAEQTVTVYKSPT